MFDSYRHTWKSRHNHFLRHSDVKPRESPRPTVNELAGQKYIKQKINGWKIYHLTSQMGDVIDMETELTSRLSQLQKKLDKHALNEVNKDVSKIQELIKANLQRSKVIQVMDLLHTFRKCKINHLIDFEANRFVQILIRVNLIN